jgi:hypothetical protein
MRTNTQEAVLPAYIASIGKRIPRDAAGLVLNHFESDPRGYAVYLDLPDGSYNSFGGLECGFGIGR